MPALSDRRHTLPLLRHLRAFVRSDAEHMRWGQFPHETILTRPQAQLAIRNGVNAAVDGSGTSCYPWDRSRRGGQYLFDLRYKGDVLWCWRGLAHSGNRHHRRRYRQRLARVYRKDPDRVPLCLTRLDECGACRDILRLAGVEFGEPPPYVPMAMCDCGRARCRHCADGHCTIYPCLPPVMEPWPARVVAG